MTPNSSSDITHPPSVQADAVASESQVLALALAQAAEDRKGGDIVILKVDEVSYLTDYFVIVTGFSQTQVRSMIKAMEDAAAACERQPNHRERQSEATWMVLDYGDVIAHVLMPEQRDFYDLEAFWGHGERLEWFPASPSSLNPSEASLREIL